MTLLTLDYIPHQVQGGSSTSANGGASGRASGRDGGGGGCRRSRAMSAVLSATRPIASPESIAAAERAKRDALRTALTEGLAFEPDPKGPTGLLGVRARGTGDTLRYTATITWITGRLKRKARVLGTSFLAAEEAALFIARARKALKTGQMLPF